MSVEESLRWCRPAQALYTVGMGPSDWELEVTGYGTAGTSVQSPFQPRQLSSWWPFFHDYAQGK